MTILTLGPEPLTFPAMRSLPYLLRRLPSFWLTISPHGTTHAIPPHRPRQRPPGHRRAERPGAVGGLGVLRQGGQPRRGARSRRGVALPRTHGLQGDAATRRLGVNRDFDRVGAKHNAQTSEEDTFYHVTCLPEYLPQSLRGARPTSCGPSLREDDFETEKKVIIEEIKMYQDNPMSVAYDAAKALHFGAHPLGQSILGTVESIEGCRSTRCATISPQVQSREHRSRLRRHDRLGPARRPGQGPLRRLGGRRDRAPGRAAERNRTLQALLREDDQQQTVIGVDRRPAARKRRPLRRAAADDRPRRPHRLAPLLGAGRPRPCRRGRAVVPGLQPGRRLLHLPELRSRGNSGQPRPGRRGLPRRAGRKASPTTS